MRKVAIIILNWNGWKDTCECIASISQSHFSDCQIIVIDNGSQDGSHQKIQAFCRGEWSVNVGPYAQGEIALSCKFLTLSDEEFILSSRLYAYDVVIVRSDQNLGFARGSNLGIQYAVRAAFQYAFLLNNDTSLDLNCLGNLIDYAKKHTQIPIITPLILNYYKPNEVWYFGGKLTFTGRRAIYYEGRDLNEIKETTKSISFVSGCALLVRTEIFVQYGTLTEKFFFGEEDYEFSWRMMDHNVKMVVISNAKVYHKIATSHTKFFNEGKLPYMFIGYLNRFVDRKNHTRYRSTYDLWRFLCLIYIAPKLVILHKYSLKRVIDLVHLLIKYSSAYDEVSKETFIQSKTLFD